MPCPAKTSIRRTERTEIHKVGGFYVRLIRLLDEETWPDGVRGTVSIAVAALLMAEFLVMLMVTP